MSALTVKFINKEYSIPEDVLTYIELLKFTDNVQKQLASAFVRKLNHEIKQGNVGCLDDKDLSAEIEQQVGKFIAKLCDNGIFTRTICDYLKDNKGYQLYSDVNKAALEKMKSLLIQEMDAWQAGYENAVNKAESNITGMEFSIWSGSFVNHAIYAAMQASTINKQEKEAQAQYQKDMNDLRSRLDSQYGGEKSNYINNTYIPNMEAALTVFAYELLDKYVDDLISNDKFDRKTLGFVDIGRSNDFLKNLTLSENKIAILENAFLACPYNIAVYMQAMKYELLDFDSFRTAKIFKQSDEILSFLKSSWGEVSYPTKFNINYHCIDILSLFTEKLATDLLYSRTEQYVTGIVKAYSRVADMLDDKELCHKIIREFDDNSILAGDAISKGKAHFYVDSIVTPNIWKQLVDKCGQIELLDRIKAFVPNDLQVYTKRDVDEYFIGQLLSNFEEARENIIIKINAKKEVAEKQRIEQERQKAEQERLRQEKQAKRKVAFKKGAKISAFIIAGIMTLAILGSLVLLFVNNVIIPANRYNDVVTLMESGDWFKARDILLSLDGYKDSEDLLEKCNNKIRDYKYDSAVQMMNDKKYEDAISVFEELDGHKDSADLIEQCKISLLHIAYNNAVQLMESGEFESAISLFESIADYKDSKGKIEECKNGIKENLYYNAIALANEGDYKASVIILKDLDGYKDSVELIKKYNLLGCEKGDEIIWGSYEQDGDTSNGAEEIEWIVLKRDGNKALVISKYCLEQKPFNQTLAAVTWEKCTLRKWMNSTFLNTAFSAAEQIKILSSNLSNEGKDTVDKVFLLSEDEATQYFKSDSERTACATEYVNTSHCYWLLRTTGSVSNVAHVDYKGVVGYYENVDRNWWVRPAMWIEISK